MSIAMPLPLKIAQDLGQQVPFRTLTAQFGNGYRQDAPDGINHTLRTIQPRWVNLSASEKTTVLSALNSAGAWTDIDWQPPDAAGSLKFRITSDGYSVVTKGGNVFDISCTMNQVP